MSRTSSIVLVVAVLSSAVRAASPAPPASGETTPAQTSPAEVVRIRGGVVGGELYVGGYIPLLKDCILGQTPEVSIINPPSHGTLVVRTEPHTLSVPNFICGLGPWPRTNVYYQATSVGNDTFVFQMSSPPLPTRILSVSVEVR
jgi:hypothetical protein